MTFGTLSVLDTLASSQQTVTEFGEDQAFGAISAALAVHNVLVAEQLADLVEFTNVRLGRYGGVSEGEMEDVDEFGAVDTQKVSAGQNIGTPLRAAQYAVQWTRLYMQTHTASELAAQYNAGKDADIRGIQRGIRRAIYLPTNNLAYKDRRVDNVVLPILALLNADGQAIPYGPDGEAFDGATHTHYLATAALVAANVSALIETVVEHGVQGQVMLYINRAQEAAIRAMANFQPYMDARTIPSTTTSRADGDLDMTRYNNRAIGTFDAAEVWVKPWVLASYPFSFDKRGTGKPLRFRTRSGQPTGMGALNLAADHEHYPLRAQHMEREYGISVWNRANGAVLFTGGASYVAPSI